MKTLYLIVNLAILAGPFALSFDRRVAFYRRWPALAATMLPVSMAYLVWDVVVTRHGHWWFNSDYSGVITIAGLPLGEILFFVTVPYACLFIYEVLRAYVPDRRGTRGGRAAGFVRITGVLVSIALLLAAAAYRDQGYTVTALVSVAAMVVVTIIVDPGMWTERHTWLFLVVSYVPFLVANGVLTALPIVGYDSGAIWGIRVYTIPLEDFLYNVGMLGFYLVVYRLVSRRIGAAEVRA